MIWRFGEFELDEVRFELRRGGERVPIAPKPLALLLYLAKRHPASVPRDELLRALWPSVRVTAASLARAVLAARHAVGEGAHDEGVIRTVRGRGYALSNACIPAAVPGAAVPSEAPLVGRGSELAYIEAALDNVAEARGRLLFISGEPGIGKSRLLDELAARARARGALVVAGYCWEDEGAPPYWPWPEILRGLVGACEELPIRSSVEQLIADLPLHGAEPLHGERGLGALTDADARFRLFQEVTDVLRQAARERLLVVVIEDLHWARPGALHLLRFAGRALANASTLMVVTYRSTGPPPNPGLEAATGELAALPHAVAELRLAGFSGEETATYVRQVSGRQADADLVRRLQAAAGGNPLFLQELIPLFVASDAAEELRGETPVPSGISHVVQSQVARLSGPARALVEIASVNGREFAPLLLARVSGRRLETVLERLEEARGENLIEAERSGGFRFRHDVIRAALFDTLRPARRIELHWRVAKALEGGAETQARLAQLAHHCFQALPRVGPEKTVRYATRAAEAARRALDFDGAAHHYRQAVAALEAQRCRSAAQRCDLLLYLGEVLELAGQLTQSREAILEAAQLARELRSFTRLGRAALAMTAWYQMRLEDPEAVQLVEDALRAVGRRPIALRARLLARLAMARSVANDAVQAERLLEDALALARRRNDPALRCDVLVEKLSILQRQVPGDHAARLNLTAELLEAATRAEHVYAVLQCRRHRVALFLECGAGTELDEEIAHFTRESTTAHCKLHYVAAFRAMRAIVSGRFEEALRAIDEAETLADPQSLEERRFTPASHRLTLPPEYRDNEALVRTIAQIIHDVPDVVGWRPGHALAALDVGRADIARAELDLLARDDFAPVERNMSYVVMLSALSEVSWRLREPRYALRLYELLRPHTGTQVAVGFGVAYRGPVDWFLGVLAMLLGRRRDAARHFKVALDTTERLGAWPWHARTALTYAELLGAGSATDQRRAHALAVSAAGAATRLGMKTLGNEAARLVASISHPGRSVAR